VTPVSDFVDKLQAGVSSAAVLLLGDSTGNNSNEWFYTSMQWLGQRLPAYTVTHMAWSDLLQGWDAMSNAAGGIGYAVQTGTAGDAYLSFPGTAVSLTCPDAASLRITGDLDVRAKINPAAWSIGAGNQTITSKFGNAGQRAWRLYIGSNGSRLVFNASLDGTNLVTATSSANLNAVFADGTAGFVRVTYTAATQAIDFYTSTNGGLSWNALGTTQTLTGVTSLFAATASPEIGGRGGGTEPFIGKIYYVEWRSGIGTAGVPKLIVDMDAAIVPSLAASNTFKASLGNTWTRSSSTISASGAPGLLLFNGSTPGKDIAYSNDGTRGPLQRAVLPPDLTFINYSHNEGTLSSYTAPYQALITSLLAAFPTTGIIPVTQNPETAPVVAANMAAHQTRNQQIFALAKAAGYSLVDAFFLMSMSGSDMSTFVSSSDGIHPTATGDEFWRGVATNLFVPYFDRLESAASTRSRRTVVEVG
jgi:hypothetical protein